MSRKTTADLIAAYGAECRAHGETLYVPCDSRSPYHGDSEHDQRVRDKIEEGRTA